MSLTIVGLGPGPWGELTLEAQRLLEDATEIYLRARHHPALARFPALASTSFDHAACPEEVGSALLPQARLQAVLYAVPGHPLEDASARHLIEACRQEGIPTRLVPGLGLRPSLLAALGLPPQELPLVDPLELRLSSPLPNLLAPLTGDLAVLRRRLLETYPPRHPASLVALEEGGACLAWQGPLEELGQGTCPPLAGLYLPALVEQEDLSRFETLVGLIARLRGPGGCPWDREQTPASLKRFLLEETYEALAALDEGNPQKLCEELGDLLLEVLLQAQIARELGEFEIGDAIRGINQKLLRRHPHVFGGAAASSAQEVVQQWETLKQNEREEGASLLEGVPPELPALAYSQAVQRKAAEVGFDWKDFRGVLDKLAEEVREVEKAQGLEERSREFGDLLFALVNGARWLGVDPEEALRLANRRFVRRFTAMEEAGRQRGIKLESLSLEEMDQLWEEAKKKEGAEDG